MSTARALALWFGSFLIVGTFLVVYCHLPLLPLLLAGGVTLLITLARSWFSRRM